MDRLYIFVYKWHFTCPEFASNFPLIRSQTAVLSSILFLKQGSKAVTSPKKNLMSSFFKTKKTKILLCQATGTEVFKAFLIFIYLIACVIITLYRVDRFPQTLFFKSARNAVSPFSAAKCLSSFWMIGRICPTVGLFSVETQSVQV